MSAEETDFEIATFGPLWP